MSERKVIDQQIVDAIFLISISIYENKWFKEKERTREEVREWVAKQLANFQVYTVPCGSSWGVLISEEEYLKLCQKEE